MFEPEELMARIVDLEEQLKVSEMAPPAAEQLIACLEGEIAKRDEELAACRVSVENCEVFRAELATIKEQEPIGWYTEDHLDDKSATTYSWTVAERWVEKGWPVSPLYAAPVPEAKAQGVVMQSTDGGRNPRYEGLFDGETEEQRASRLNAAPVVSGRNTMDAGVCVTDCRSSDGVAVGIIDAVITLARVFNGREVTPAVEEALIDLRSDEDVISMISFTPVVSGQGVPDGWKLVPVEPTPKMIDATWYHEIDMSCGIESQGASNKRIYEAMLAAAPAAPAADAGGVLEQAMYTLISIGYHENSGLVHELRQALAAHRAKGVV